MSESRGLSRDQSAVWQIIFITASCTGGYGKHATIEPLTGVQRYAEYLQRVPPVVMNI